MCVAGVSEVRRSWAKARPQRKVRNIDALKKCADDALDLHGGAAVLGGAQDRHGAHPDVGDAWGWWLRPQARAAAWECGADGGRRGALQCAAAEPHRGRRSRTTTQIAENRFLNSSRLRCNESSLGRVC
ncbi:hypothetical protein H4582DRAFT_460982 [Lactarius indigo]|nr:hypothetical protein H4582DRAFT_460982 [Lactarius indigo]